jgi:hypothetical protein
VFWIKLAADWEDQNRQEFWTNENLNTVESMASFLTAHWDDTVANGHVALTAYGEPGQTNLTHRYAQDNQGPDKICNDPTRDGVGVKEFGIRGAAGIS